MANKFNSWSALNQRIVHCEACPRLRAYCATIASEKRKAYRDEDYWGRPLPNFGDPQAKFLIVGLAPAAHGGNRTGRMFTGDRSGEWLYRALHKAGFANQPTFERADDGLQLLGCAITATCHCAPPDNKPTPAEIAACKTWFVETYDLLQPRVVLALGSIAFVAVTKFWRERQWLDHAATFAHGTEIQAIDGTMLIASYHPSQQNTFTKKLTEPMFDAVFQRVRTLLRG